MGSSLVVVGVDVGQKADPTAIVVCERERRESREVGAWELPKGRPIVEPRDIRRKVTATVEEVYTARAVERLPLGTPYPRVAKRVAEVIGALVLRGIAAPRLVVDPTGVGLPVVELIADELGPWRRGMVAATFTHGDRYEQRDGWGDRLGTASVGKAYLVSRLQALLQTERLKLPRTPEAPELAEELRGYEIRVDQDANDKYGAFKVGTHDDLVTALGLCAVYQEPPDRTLRVQRGLDHARR